MTTTRTSVDAIKADAVKHYRDGREIGLTHDEAIKRAATFSAMPTLTVEEWCEAVARAYLVADQVGQDGNQDTVAEIGTIDTGSHSVTVAREAVERRCGYVVGIVQTSQIRKGLKVEGATIFQNPDLPWLESYAFAEWAHNRNTGDVEIFGRVPGLSQAEAVRALTRHCQRRIGRGE